MAEIFKAYDIRGIYPNQLNEETAEKIGRAFVLFLKAKKIVVGRDMRPHSLNLFNSLVKGINMEGADVIDIGMCSTPMSYYANGKLGVDGSVMITASHNPAEWNGFKICREDAIPISGQTGIADIKELVNSNNWKDKPVTGKVEKYDISKEYAEHLASFAKIDKKFTVVADFANAMGSYEIAGIRKFFNIIPLFEELDGSFPNHEANPLKHETLTAIREKVREVNADFGAAFDGDADRCGFIDENGDIIPNDMFTAVIALDVLSRGPAAILYDLRSSRSVRECIEENGGKAIMSRVGHAFIKAQMRECGAVFAGELSGHYYFKENYTAESQGLALVSLANVLCRTGKKVSELIKPLKKYYSSGEINFKVNDTKAVLKKIKEQFTDGHVFELDGLSVEYKDWWFNMRPSNTEPLLRLIVEADTQELMEQQKNKLSEIIRAV